MAEKKSSEVEKEMNLNLERKGFGTKTEPQKEKVVNLNNSIEESGGTEAEPWFKRRARSVFPAKRKLVKTMVFESIVQSFSVFVCCLPCFGGSVQPDDDNSPSTTQKVRAHKE